MDARTKQRLERLRDDLAEIDELHGNFRFRIIYSEPETLLMHAQSWQFLEQHLGKGKDTVVLFPKPHFFDPFDGGKRCVFWNGNSDGIEAFKKWLTRLGAFLKSQPDLLPSKGTEKAVPAEETKGELPRGKRVVEPKCPVEKKFNRTLACLWSLALLDPAFSESICEWDIVDTKKLPPASLPIALQQQEKLPPDFLPVTLEQSPKFVMQEPTMRATEFGAMMIDRLLGQFPRPPRLTVNDTTNIVWLDSVPYEFDILHIHILKIIADAKGHPVSRAKMKEDTLLNEEERLDRTINLRLKKRHKAIGDLIHSDRRGYWIDKEYLE